MTSSGKRFEDCTDEELVAELARRRGARGPVDMSAMEEALDAAQLQDRRCMLDTYVAGQVATQDDQPKPCPRCGQPARVRARDRSRTVRTVSGTYTIRRHQHYCASCQHGFYPLDDALGLPDEGEVIAYMERRVFDFGVNEPFAQAAARWNVHYPVPISDGLVRAVVDRVGRRAEGAEAAALQQKLRASPATPSALVVVQTDGSMVPTRGDQAWREAKLAVLYRAEHHVRGESGLRGQLTEARYVAVLGSQNEFRPALDTGLQAERVEAAATVAWLGDGAPGNWTLADELCPHAVQILDWVHVTEHASDGGKAVLGETDPLVAVWQRSIEGRLWQGDVATVCEELTACMVGATPAQREALEDLHRYYSTNAARMRYGEFRERDLPIGTGTVESGHRHVLQDRMKRSGQHWDVVHGHRLVQLRAAYKTAGPERVYAAIQTAPRRTPQQARAA
jgi:hypothetical protein